MIVGALTLSAQEKSITEAEYIDAVTKAEKSLYGGVHGPVRQIMENEVLTEGQPDYRLKSVALIAPGQGTHRIIDRSFGGKPTKVESLTVSDRHFVRNADGSWKELSADSRSASDAANPGATERNEVDSQLAFKYLGTENLGDRKVHVYTRTAHKKTVDPKTGSATESDTVTKVRIGADGSYLKQEIFTKSSFSTGKAGTIKINIEVTADPTIKIAAPDVS